MKFLDVLVQERTIFPNPVFSEQKVKYKPKPEFSCPLEHIAASSRIPQFTSSEKFDTSAWIANSNFLLNLI